MKKKFLMLMQCFTLVTFIIIALACASNESLVGGGDNGDGAQLIPNPDTNTVDAVNDVALN